MRKWLKIGFWISLLIIMVAPIMLGIFKARMLPKADKDQVYLWIDAPNNATIETTGKIAREAEKFFLGYKKTESQSGSIVSGEVMMIRILPKNLRMVESISSAIGDRLPADFANLFRGGNNRISENQISMRVSLTHAKERDMKSEDWVIAVRPILEKYLRDSYKDIKVRLLEDPPGPPTQATFHVKIQ